MKGGRLWMNSIHDYINNDVDNDVKNDVGSDVDHGVGMMLKMLSIPSPTLLMTSSIKSDL
jgi:hypothetical protein